MALSHKWGVKFGFAFALQFFMLISDGLGGVYYKNKIHITKGNYQEALAIEGYTPPRPSEISEKNWST